MSVKDQDQEPRKYLFLAKNYLRARPLNNTCGRQGLYKARSCQRFHVKTHNKAEGICSQTCACVYGCAGVRVWKLAKNNLREILQQSARASRVNWQFQVSKNKNKKARRVRNKLNLPRLIVLTKRAATSKDMRLIGNDQI